MVFKHKRQIWRRKPESQATPETKIDLNCMCVITHADVRSFSSAKLFCALLRTKNTLCTREVTVPPYSKPAHQAYKKKNSPQVPNYLRP